MIKTLTGAAMLSLGAFALVMPASGAGPAAREQAATVATAQRTFATADEAVSALVAAARADNRDVLQAILGPGSQKLLDSGDRVADADRRNRFLAAYDERHELTADGSERMILKVGKDDWPLPIPIVRADGSWRFDTPTGLQELVDRFIGRNEIAAIRTALAYVDAQKEYAALTGRNGTAEYAQRILAAPGKFDGLYWPPGEGVPKSPLEPLVAQAREAGYPVDRSAQGPRPYHGYYFRVLTGQGANSPEGARNYISNGHMTNGFALVAWPATYGASGIMTFVVNQSGIVFQKDLGRRTASTAAVMKLFDPDLSWAKVEVVTDR